MKQKAFAFIDGQREAMLALWQELVNAESGSSDKPGVDALARRIRGILSADGAQADMIEFEKAGNMVVATVGPERKGAPVGLLGHFDTVFPKGTTAQRPFVIKDGKAYGPGVLDMKGGVVILLYAIKALQAAGYASRPLKVLLAGDEEVGHMDSRAAEIFQQEVKGCAAAFNFETGYVDDQIVVGRKGGGIFTMEVRGVAAHAGNAPRTGRSAILEIAHKIIEIQALTDWKLGTTFSVGTIKGGSTSNTIPDYAAMEIDVRCVNLAAAAERLARLQAIAESSHIEGTRTTLSGRMVFQPMETTPDIMRLFERVAEVSVENGFNRPVPTQSGGGSDSSNAAIAGVPTICSMGVKGGRNHSPEEFALVESLFERCKLAVAVILDLDQQV
ncbi:MAG: M20 family metallopeptidase [Holophaga sp.]|nr:M20 family metallopeptidase [Holophaga sp.]